MKTINRFLTLFCCILFLYSCSFTEAIQFQKQLNNTKVNSVDFELNDKQVHYIDMIHLGQKQFYENVQQKVIQYKQDGYVLFYEFIDFDDAKDITLRKVRKLVGFIPSPAGYEQFISQLNIEGVVAQNNDHFLNQINDLDFRVDLTPEKLIEVYEKSFGEIILTKEDYEIPLTQKVEAEASSKAINAIILDYRNQYLAQEIQKSKYKKILVLYGAKHQQGLLKELQKLDTNWKKLPTK